MVLNKPLQIRLEVVLHFSFKQKANMLCKVKKTNNVKVRIRRTSLKNTYTLVGLDKPSPYILQSLDSHMKEVKKKQLIKTGYHCQNLQHNRVF